MSQLQSPLFHSGMGLGYLKCRSDYMPPLWLQRDDLHFDNVRMCTAGPWYTGLYLPIMKEPNHFKLNPFNLSSQATPLGCSTDLGLTHTHTNNGKAMNVSAHSRQIWHAPQKEQVPSATFIHTHIHCVKENKKRRATAVYLFIVVHLHCTRETEDPRRPRAVC